jgi:hypothetical protein
MSACKHGQRDAAILLYQWNRAALHLRRPADGASAVDVAIRAGHPDIAREIQRLEKRREASFGGLSSSKTGVVPAHGKQGTNDGKEGEFRRPADPKVSSLSRAASSCEDHRSVRQL